MVEMEYILFQNFCRMNSSDFIFLLNRVDVEISLKNIYIYHLEKRFLQQRGDFFKVLNLW